MSFPEKGTYTMKPDCTGTQNPGPLNMVMVDNGKKIYAIAAVAGQVVTATLTRM